MASKNSIISSLKALLRSHGITYKQLGHHLDMSEAGVKRAFANGTFTIKRLEDISRIIGLTFSDIVRHSFQKNDVERRRLTIEQEDALASDQALFSVFYLVTCGLEPAFILKNYSFGVNELNAYLRELDRLRLIDLHLGMSVKPLKDQDLEWNSKGPLKTRYSSQLRHEFIESEFEKPDEFLVFTSGKLTSASFEVLQKKSEQLIRDFRALAEIDTLSRKEEAKPVWVLTACRPWLFSVVSNFKRKVQGFENGF